MILSKAALSIATLAAGEKSAEVLQHVHVSHDGAVIAAGGKVVIAVEGVSDEIKKSVPLEATGFSTMETDGLTVAADTAVEVERAIKRDTTFGGLLEYASLDADGKWTWTDGKRKRSLVGRVLQRAWLPWRKAFKELRAQEVTGKAAVNLGKLRSLLDVIAKACGDGDEVLFMEFTKERSLLLRTVNRKTGQRVTAVAAVAYEGAEDKWLELSKWEEKLYYENAESMVRRTKRGVRKRNITADGTR